MSGSGPRTYIEAIRSSSFGYTDLVKLRNYLERHQFYPGRAAVLEFGVGSVERIDFPNARTLKTYFSGTAGNSCKHRLYLLEDLSTPFVEAFGAHFWMDPFLFASQENSTHWTGLGHDYALPRRLPSSQKLDPSFTLRYYEVVKSAGNDIEKKGWKTVSNVDRKIELGDLNHAFERHRSPRPTNYVVRRNASFWSQGRRDGGWDALILVDPPVGDSILVSDRSRRMTWHNNPYGSGYVDFTPWNGEKARSMRRGTIGGPPRSSTLDDIAYYWTNCASAQEIAGARRDAAMSSIFLKKIIASNWNILLEFVWAKLSEFEREIGKFEGKRLDYLAETLANVHLLRRRLAWWYDEVEMSLRSARIAAAGPSDDDGNELLSVLSRLQGCKEMVESLTPIVMGMLNVHQADVSTTQADISLREARLVSKLTFVALVFLPLSFTASIFSMGEGFLPGNSRFWVYFAVAVPITLIILALARLWLGKSFLSSATEDSIEKLR